MNLTTLGIDLAKTSSSLAGMDQHGKVVLRKILKRSQLLPAECPSCLIGMKSKAGTCSGHHGPAGLLCLFVKVVRAS